MRALWVSLAVLTIAVAAVASTPVPPLWGDLQPGPHAVGFRAIFRFDRSRTWHITRDYTGHFTADRAGRPIQLNVWYPAVANASGPRMMIGNYVEQSAPADFATLSTVMTARSRENLTGSVAPAQVKELLIAQTYAIANAPSAEGRFPTLLYFGGMNSDINSNFVLCEYLASHGYIVASVSLLGPSEYQTSQARTPSDLDAVVRDMEFSLNTLSAETHADLARIAVAGHSLGAIESVMLALQNGNVTAVVGLDGTYGFQGNANVLTATYGYSPAGLRAALLDLRRAPEAGTTLDGTVVRSQRHSDRTSIQLANMHHSDFTAFAMIGRQFRVPTLPKYAGTGWNRDTGAHGYEQACRIVLEFLNERTAGVAANLPGLLKSVAPASFEHLDAAPSVPSPREAVAIGSTQGLDALQALITRTCAETPLATCVDAELFNSYGYELLGKREDRAALQILQIAAWSHPASANAQDSLADAYLRVGEKENARRAIQRAIQLSADDVSLDANSKAAFLAEENRRLKELQ